MSRKLIIILLVCALAGALLVACNKGDQGKAQEGISAVGEAVQVKDAVITLNSASISANKVKANFTVKNSAASELVIDPATFFTVAGENEGEVVKLEIDPTCRNNVLKGSIPAGGELTGELCWRSDPTLTWPALATITYEGASWQVKVEE